MSWRSDSIMDQRTEFVLKSLDKTVVFQNLCQEFGISRKTGYKWRERFFAEGLDGLYDRSRKPRHSPTQLTEDVVCELIRLKARHRSWGSKKIRELYRRNHGDPPSESSIKRVLTKAGLVTKRRVRRHPANQRLQCRKQAEEPNDLWTVDFKGWWLTSSRVRCEPLTIRDDYSKYILSINAMSTTKMDAVKVAFGRVFETYGLPKIIRSDNGVPFASNAPLGLSKLSAWWLALGIDLDRIEPGHPEQNGSHERMHLDMKRELQGQVPGELREHQNAFDIWRKEFNWERPHESLGMKTPAEVYTKSDRSYDGLDPDIEYPFGYLPRKVSNRGTVSFEGIRILLSTALSGRTVGLEPLNGKRAAVWFDRLRLGEIELKTQSMEWAEIERSV